MKPWIGLTNKKIDALEGEDLSLAVGEAMGLVKREIARSRWVEMPDGRFISRWHPHDDANQALDVWKAIPTMKLINLSMHSGGETGVFLGPPPMIAIGTFCEAICRAYLKARLAEIWV